MDFSDRIIVGYDGSDQSAMALRWAARLAAAGDRELAIIHAWVYPLITKDLGPTKGISGSGHRNVALKLLEDALAIAEQAAPGVRARTVLITGRPRTVLEAASRTALLMVVGSRGLGGFFGMLLGSVSLGLITHAGCPVIVVRENEEPHGPVVVGVDGSEPSLDAIDAGVRIAQALGEGPELLHVRRTVEGQVLEGDGAERIVEEATARAHASDPQLEVTSRMVEEGNEADALLRASAEAGILVLGYQGSDRRRFGSTVHAVVHHAQCTTVVCRHEYQGADPDTEQLAVEVDDADDVDGGSARA
ncbi:universal stress protein [Brachybacterium endophyticum]|uniref:Universal stress protein n=1 Tax=Brachybacterium endophyticum TaxID=2182385 RepID=A0A2U2RN89_9MICO|nr:universal stress protein [Brachybacterium endophyticum]PWH07328.1 universal stress protein [Brachybacterium endophyticum]